MRDRMTEEDLLKFIEKFRGMFYGSEIVFKNGSCMQFCMLIQRVWGPRITKYSAAPYYVKEEDHVVTQINGRFFDITGEVFEKVKGEFINLRAFGNEGLKQRLIDNKFSLFNPLTCPHCDEGIDFEESYKR